MVRHYGKRLAQSNVLINLMPRRARSALLKKLVRIFPFLPFEPA